MSKNLDQLRQIAENATPGPWMEFHENGTPGEYEAFICPPATGARLVDYAPRDQRDKDALYIATFDPPTVLALIERVEAAEAALASQRGVVKTLAERNVELTKFKDAYSLQAQELEQAEAERDFRQKENKELFEQIERVREFARYHDDKHVMMGIEEALDGGQQE